LPPTLIRDSSTLATGSLFHRHIFCAPGNPHRSDSAYKNVLMEFEKSSLATLALFRLRARWQKIAIMPPLTLCDKFASSPFGSGQPAANRRLKMNPPFSRRLAGVRFQYPISIPTSYVAHPVMPFSSAVAS
jgi:hypothetical protein